jgi:hypothetical protein
MHLFDPSMPVWAMFVCPSLLSGLMVGKLACNVKQIEQISQARVWAAPRDTSAQYVSFFICSNNPDATRMAYSMLEARAHQQMQSLGPPAGIMGMPPAPAAVPSAGATAAAGAAAAGEGVPSAATTAPATATKKKDGQGGKTKDKSSAKKEKEPKEKETSCSSSTTTTPATSDDDASSTDTEPSTQQPSRAASASPPATNKGDNPRSPKGGALTRDASNGGESANHQAASPVKASANATDSKKNGSVEINKASSSAGASKKKAGKAAAAVAAVATSAENANEEIVAEAAAEVSN